MRILLEQFTVDLSLPLLAPAILPALSQDGALSGELREALNRKDQASIERLTGDAAPLLTQVMATAGPAAEALADLGLVGRCSYSIETSGTWEKIPEGKCKL